MSAGSPRRASTKPRCPDCRARVKAKHRYCQGCGRPDPLRAVKATAPPVVQKAAGMAAGDVRKAVADGLPAGLAGGLAGLSAAIEALGEHLWAMAAADVQRRDFSAKSHAMSVRGAQEPHQIVPYDPVAMPLEAYLRGACEVSRVNGHGAPAPEGGQQWPR